jgi:hypothetical protein
LLTVTIFILAGTWIHNQVEEALHQIISENLQAILKTDIAAIEFWMEQERSNVISWAEEENLREITQALQTLAVSTSTPTRDLPMAPEQARLRDLLEPLLDTDNYLGFAIINSTGLILATGANDARIIGQRLTAQGQIGLASIFTQQAGWIPPFWRGQYLDSESLQEDITLMGVSATIPDSANQPQAALLLFIPPEKDFTRILSIARMGLRCGRQNVVRHTSPGIPQGHWHASRYADGTFCAACRTARPGRQPAQGLPDGHAHGRSAIDPTDCSRPLR